MDLKQDSELYLLSPAVTNIDENVVSELSAQMYRQTNKNLVIDMTGVVSCVNRFFVMLSEITDKNVTLVNVDSVILSVLYMTGFDKYVKIFGDEVSLSENANQLINRRMYVCR